MLFLLSQNIPHHNATVMLRAACMGPNIFLEWRPMGLMVCGLCDEVHSLAEWHVASQQCSTHVGQQAFWQVSNSRRSISACCTGNIVLGCNVAPKLKGPLSMLNISCFSLVVTKYILCTNVKNILQSKINMAWSEFTEFFSISTCLYTYYNLIIKKYIKSWIFFYFYYFVWGLFRK